MLYVGYKVGVMWTVAFCELHFSHYKGNEATVSYQLRTRSWQSGSGDLHAAPFLPMRFVTVARSLDLVKHVRAPYHVTCHVASVCTLPSLPSDTPWRMNTSFGLIRPVDVCNECGSSVTWPIALYAREQDQKFTKSKVAEHFFNQFCQQNHVEPCFRTRWCWLFQSKSQAEGW